MSDVSKQIRSFSMEIDSCQNAREEFNVLLRMEEYIKKVKSDQTHELSYVTQHSKKYKDYFTIASDLMIQDIVHYLNEFKDREICPGNKYYKFETSYVSKKLGVRIIEPNKILLHGLRQKIEYFPRYTIYLILGLDKTLGEEYIKHNHFIIKEEYEEFLKLRATNPEYFVPYIQDILNIMQNYVEVKV